MRPHRLMFSGIGSYPGTVEINFDELNHKGLYLIVGPTGAGKTTLLDAMTYALYGKVAQDRENALISAHAGSKPPVLEFEFSHADRRYVVHREPVPSGTKLTGAKQWMREYDLSGEVVRTVTGAIQVSAKSQEIIGLKADEFMQVILLPQGKFQQFLMAKGSDKQKVLQTIFGTRAYRRIVDRLEEEAKELREDVESDNQRLAEHRAVVNTNTDALRKLDIFTDLPDPSEDLDSVLRRVREISGELDRAEKLARESYGALQGEATLAATEAVRFDKAQKLESLREQQDAQRVDAEHARDRLDLHKRAEPVVLAAEDRNSHDAAANELAKKADETRAQLTRVARSFRISADVARQFTDAIPTATPVTLSTEFTKLWGHMDNASTNLDDLDEVRKNITTNEEQAGKVQTELSEITMALQAMETSAGELRAQLADNRKKVRALPAAARAVDKLDQLLPKADVHGAQEALLAAQVALNKANDKLDRAESRWRSAQERRTAELAGILAGDLSPGDECPVCGSTAHPRKARKPAKGTVDVDAAETARATALRRQAEAERNLKEAQGALEDAKAHKSKLPDEAEQERIRQALVDLEETSDAIDGMQKELEVRDSRVEEGRIEEGKLRTAETEIRADGRELVKRRKSLEAAVAKIGTAEEITAALAVSEEIGTLLGDLERISTNLETARAKTTLAGTNAGKALKTSRYASEEEAKAVLLDDDIQRALGTLLEEFDSRAEDIGKLEAAVGTEPLPESRPDVDDINRRVKQASSDSEAASDIAGTVRTSLGQISDAHKKISSIGPAIEEKERQAREATSIAKVFDDGAGNQLSLEVWVQRTLFDEVCLVANEQLRSLSSNRYSLTLEQEEGGVRKRRGSGLDLYVLDSYTGTTRPVQTMSGGEQFIASLALALAEVVQRHAGGIELPCLFIDEGFGGLDLESLDVAIEVLGKIHAAGRTVGIITHVETMQQQLPIGIRVHKSDRGSTVEVLAG